MFCAGWPGSTCASCPQETAPPVRFDVLSVYLVPGQKKEFHHFEGSFDWSEGRDRDDWN